MGKIVLHVEDDETCARVVARTLRTLQLEMVHVDGNSAAYEFLASTVPSLIITDLRRPDGIGEDLVEHVRADGRLRSTPIIILSGQTFRGAEPRLFEHRIDAALAKPFTQATLLRVVARCLSDRDGELNPDEALVRVGAESKSLDYKLSVDLNDKKQRACLAKDIIAFFNSGGGSIVVGVNEEARGRFVPVGVAEDVAGTLEVTRLNDALRRYIGTELSVGARRISTNDGKLFVVIEIPASTTHLAFAREEHQGAALYPGRIYVRNDAAQSAEVRDAATMSAIIERLVYERRRVQARASQ